MTKRIGVLTSGGDCAGLNAAIRAVVCAADRKGWQTVGLLDGTACLFEDPPQVRELHPQDFDGNILRRGGTILGTTNKGNPFDFPMPDGTKKDRSEEIVAGFQKLGLDTVVVIGGDGSFAIVGALAKKAGINIIGIPKTIDNDLGVTETSIGHDTAVMVATEALDRLQPTAASHDRIMVVEVMGRDAGHLAISAGIAGGADVILIPEIPYKLENVARKINEVKESGRNFALVVVSEAVKTEEGNKFQMVYKGGETRYGGIGNYIGEQIANLTGSETRVTILGHVQRGGSPTYSDRLLASALGTRAVELIAENKKNRMVAWQNRSVIDVPIEDAIATYQQVEADSTLVKTARSLGISLGDQ